VAVPAARRALPDRLPRRLVVRVPDGHWVRNRVAHVAMVDAAETALLEFAESEFGKTHKAVSATWQDALGAFTPCLAFPPEVCKIIYTTNAIESLNSQLSKMIKNRRHLPTRDAVITLLSIRDIEDKPARARAAEKGIRKKPPAGSSKEPPPTPGDPRRPHCSSPTQTASINAPVDHQPPPSHRDVGGFLREAAGSALSGLAPEARISSKQGTTPFSGGFRRSPTTSRTLASSSESAENLIISHRHGWIR
jgi:Transposase, Mutator family